MSAPDLQNLTYAQILTTLPSYLERKDAAFAEQIPRFVMLAENRIAAGLKQQGFQTVVSGQLPVGNFMPKPALWRSTISFYITVGGVQVPLYLRSLEYMKEYDSTTVGKQPVFYGDYNAKNFKLCPLPDLAYTFELVYYARLEPLSADNQSNWMTRNIPQVLLYACLLEAALWTKNNEKIAMWQAQYDSASGSIATENQERLMDRTTAVVRG